MSQFTNALEFKKALYNATKQLLAEDPETVEASVNPGLPGTFDAPDLLVFGKVSMSQSVATMGTNRSREETLTVELTISCFLGGDEDQELPSQERAFMILGKIERYVRMTDTTLGGVVRQCFLTSVETDGETPAEYSAEGRAVDVTAIFTAQNRVTG
jgi:hypothetical protein